jgi:hypothetical protein
MTHPWSHPLQCKSKCLSNQINCNINNSHPFQLRNKLVKIILIAILFHSNQTNPTHSMLNSLVHKLLIQQIWNNKNRKLLCSRTQLFLISKATIIMQLMNWEINILIWVIIRIWWLTLLKHQACKLEMIWKSYRKIMKIWYVSKFGSFLELILEEEEELINSHRVHIDQMVDETK